MSLSVKLFVKSADSDDVQIRRFAVDEDVSACCEYLTAKIRATVPGAGDAALKLFWKDEDGEMISFSGDEELVEALGHVTDGVLRVYVELPDASSLRHPSRPDQFLAAISTLLDQFTGGPQGAGESTKSASTTDCGSERKSRREEKEAEKDEETCRGRDERQHFRQLVVDTSNSFLEPMGLKVVDQRRQSSCDKVPSAGAGASSMTSSCDQDNGVDDDKSQQDAPPNCRDSHDADDVTMATARGHVSEMLSSLGCEAELGGWLTNLIVHHAGQLAQALSAAEPPPHTAATC